MNIKAKFFAILREKAGASETEVRLPDGATVAAAAQLIAKKFPAIAELAAKSAFAVNQEYAPSDQQLKDGDELAFIPAVSGG